MLAIDDIDAEDHGNPQLCAEYVQEIYHYMRQLEVCSALWKATGDEAYTCSS